jgi:hypothetical protein
MARFKGVLSTTATVTDYFIAKDMDESERERPDQYKGGIDTFDRIEANCNLEERLAFIKGGIDKYNWRKKGQDIADFKKIIDYANFGIKQLKDEEIKTQK